MSMVRSQRLIRELASVDKDDRVVHDVVLSDGTVDSWGTRIDPSGWDLERFNKNPMLLWGHDTSNVDHVLGRVLNARVEGTQLLGDFEFEEKETNELAEKVLRKIRKGTIRAVSVGFEPRSYHWEEGPGTEVLVFDEQSLVEVSVLPLGANENALMPEQRGLFLPDKAKGKRIMKGLLKRLGLKEDATEEQAIAVVDAMRSVEDDLRALTGVDSAGLAGYVRGLQANAKELAEARASVKELAEARAKQEREALLATHARKFAPTELSGWVATATIEQLRAYVASAPDRVHDVVAPPTEDRAHLTADDKMVAKALGISEEAFAMTKKGFAQ